MELVKELRKLKKKFLQSYYDHANEPCEDVEVHHQWGESEDEDIILEYTIDSDLSLEITSIIYGNRDLGLENVDIYTNIINEWFNPYIKNPSWLND